MIRINLLPVRVSKKKEAGKQQLILFVLAVVLALICNFWWSRSRASELAAREEKVKHTRAEIAQLEKIIGEVKNIKDEQSAVKDKLAVLDKLKAARQGPVRMLDDLAALIPRRVWLRKVEEKSGSMNIEGSAGTIEDVSLFLTGLKKSSFFTNTELRKTAARADKKTKLVDFVVSATVNYTPSIQVAQAQGATVTKKP
jgi:type IV pilus assembly protein PilN